MWGINAIGISFIRMLPPIKKNDETEIHSTIFYPHYFKL